MSPTETNVSKTRVVITGLGVVCPLGLELDVFWDALKSGKSGISAFDSLPQESIPVKNGGQAKCFTGAIEDFGPMDKVLQRSIKKNQKVMCREIEMGVAACQRAINHANLSADQRDPERTGITYGCDYILTRPEEYTDGIKACFDENGVFCIDRWPTIGMPQVNPLWLLKYLPNMPASHVAIFNDLRGPSNSLTVREASNSLTIAEATAAIRRGAADVMVVGATGSRIEPLRFLHVTQQETLAKDRTDPSEMCRPFDSDRDGIVLGEGAAAFVIESLENATRRGATILAEVVASSATTVGRTQNGDHIRQATKNILGGIVKKAEKELGTRWHVHAAGRGDVPLDIAESQGIFDCIGNNKNIPVVASKGYLGSLGAGSAAVEVAASILALHHGELFSTKNYKNPDPNCPTKMLTEPCDPGEAFVHLAYSPQGQASAIAIRKFKS
jgi:3-oxoacyl-[acyl-carrier-protein] synthase II